MQALRLNEVLTRVVAWHNRHPLARRISASQVHSVGEVVLPFASAQATPPPPAPPGLPAMQDLLAQPATALGDLHAPGDGDQPGVGLADEAASPAPASGATEPAFELDADPGAQTSPQGEAGTTGDAALEPAPVLSMEDEADDLFSSGPPADPAASDEGGPEMLIELSTDPDEPLGTPPADGTAPPADDSAADAMPELTATEADSANLAAAFAATAATATTTDSPALPADTGTVADPSDNPPADSDGQPATGAATATETVHAATADTAPSAAAQLHPPAATPAPAGLLARLLARLRGWRRGTGARGLPRLQATFSHDFIWPLRSGQVARWARRHGSRAPLAPADWPQRLIDSDGSLQAQARRQGLPHQLPLHMLTAAIGVGDRRIRVLIDGQGHILGPRSYSPPKLATLAGVVALGLLGAGWGWLPRGDSLSPQQASAAMATAASAAALAASAANLAAAAASAADRAWRAQQAESMSAGTAPAAASAGDAGPAVGPAAPPDASPPAAGQAMPAPHSGEAVASAHAAASAPDHAPAPAQRLSAEVLGNILPVLSPAAKQTARLQAEALRSGRAAAIAARPPQAAGPVFAIVTRPTREKDSAARGLALMRASGQRLNGEAPEHGELMHSQGEWRAAWWPFESQADAERARVMLAARGLKVEVVEF